ncbi:MAG: hypothetical protein WC750_00065 [Patescibacteria group bacterium]|jgi:hypothetical protein
MKDSKTKPKMVRSKKAANSPAPTVIGSCGHSHCGEMCRVRYIGPVTSIRDHHIMHVARGVSHIWTAVIIAGLAVVLTGAVAYSSVNASNQQKDDVRSANSTGLILEQMQRLDDRLSALESEVKASTAEPATINAVFP